MISNARTFLLAGLLMICGSSQVLAATSSGGLDTPAGVNELPFSVQGVELMSLTSSGLGLMSPTSNQIVWVENNNGVFSLLNSAKNASLFSVDQNGNTTIPGYVSVQGTAVDGTACSSNGLIARNASGTLLSCSNLVWQVAGGNFGGMFTTSTGGEGGGAANPFTGRDSCPIGFSASVATSVVTEGTAAAHAQGGGYTTTTYYCWRAP